MSWELPYHFKANNKVVIRHRAPNDKYEKYVRVKPGDLDSADESGGTGEFARWEVTLEDGGAKCRIKSLKTGKYLRIHNDKVDVGGGTGPWTLFKIHKTGINTAKLESNKLEGKYFAVQPKGIAIGNGGKWTELQFWREGSAAPFTKEYMFKATNSVVMQHKGGGGFNKFLRVKPNDEDEVDPDGGKGAFAQWEADPQDGGSKVRFKSKKSGKYLRIVGGDKVNAGGGGGKFTVFKVHKSGGVVKLESVEFPGKYIAVGQNNVPRIGTGGPWCDLRIFREN